MATQAQDTPYYLDVISVLNEIGGSYSEQTRQSVNEAFIETPEAPRRGRVPNPKDIEYFIRRCSSLQHQAVSDFRAALKRVGLEDYVVLTILLGQYDMTAGSPTGSPNMFAYEIELAASCSRRIETPKFYRRQRFHTGLRALQLARRIRILDFYHASAQKSLVSEHTSAAFEAEPGFRGQLAAHWQAARGSFNTRYDWDYCSRLAYRMRQHGMPHPQIQFLKRIMNNLMDRWGPALVSFRENALQIDGTLGLIVTDFTLCNPNYVELSRAETTLLERFAELITMQEEELFSNFPPAAWAYGREWLQLLAASHSTLGANANTRTIFESPLGYAPVLQIKDRYLICLTHSITTDLSLTLESKFSDAFGEPYFRARGQELEESALECLRNALPGCEYLLGGKYHLENHAELIEVDGVIVWQDIALIVESKGGFITPQTKHGSDAAAITDLKKTIGDGYYQATRLLLALERLGKVKLRNSSNEALLLGSKAIRRAYIVVPTADDMGGVTTSLERLWRNEIIPKRAVPLVISVQDLHMMIDFLKTPLDLVSYLEYREEVLLHDEIIVADEQEILGNFVGGIDILGNVHDRNDLFRCQSSMFEWRDLKHIVFIGSDAQQKYLNPWLYSSFQALSLGMEVPRPPTRHAGASREAIDVLANRRGGFWAAVNAMQISAGTWASALLYYENRPQRGHPLVSRAGSVAAVLMTARDSFTSIKRLPEIQTVRTDSRYVVYVVDSSARHNFRSVERGRKHISFHDADKSVLKRSRTGEVHEWIGGFAHQRKSARAKPSPFELKLETELIAAGLKASSARGVVRLGVAVQVKGLAALGIPVARAANVWMTDVRRCASEQGLPLGKFSVSSFQIAAALKLVDAGSVAPEDLAQLMGLLAPDPVLSAQSIAESHGLILSNETALVEAAISRAAKDIELEKTPYDQLGPKAQNRLRTRLIAQVRRQLDSPNMKVVVELVDHHLARQ